MLRLVSLLLLLTSPLAAAPADLLADLSGWEYFTPDKDVKLADVCATKPGGGVTIAGKPTGYLATKARHDNYHLHIEWRWTEKPGNGGILVHINSGPLDRNTWPRSFQIQTKHKSVGDLLPMVDARFAEPLSSAPDVKPRLLVHSGADSEKPAGEWNAADIVCRGDTVEVTINGVRQNKVTGCSASEGKIGIQLEGTPFELRNVTIEHMLLM